MSRNLRKRREKQVCQYFSVEVYSCQLFGVTIYGTKNNRHTRPKVQIRQPKSRGQTAWPWCDGTAWARSNSSRPKRFVNTWAETWAGSHGITWDHMGSHGYLTVSISICLSVCLPGCLSVLLSVYRLIYLLIYSPVCCIYLPPYLFNSIYSPAYMAETWHVGDSGDM